MSDEPESKVVADAPLYYVIGKVAFVKVPQLRGFWWKTPQRHGLVSAVR